MQVANSGSSVIFNCSVEGEARLRWLHDGVPVGGGERALRLSPVARAHRGMYQCVAERDLDSAQASAELRLGGEERNHQQFLFNGIPLLGNGQLPFDFRVSLSTAILGRSH